MKSSSLILAASVALVSAEVPQELCHKFLLTAVQELLQIDNRFQILDPVFGLLGNAAAQDGAGDVVNLDCLHQITADEAFTNALTIEDDDLRLAGLAHALLFRGVERNTGQVGLRSVLCTEVAVNKEIAAITQHQDPASEDAKEINKQIVLSLAVELAKLNIDPTLSLLTGTFLPGDLDDATGAGNTCDDDDDDLGCIFTRRLIQSDATVEEINAAIAEALGDDSIKANEELAADIPALAALFAAGELNIAAGGGGVAPAVEDDDAEDDANAEEDEEDDAEAAAGTTINIQLFVGDLGSPAPEVLFTEGADRPFDVNGATFLNEGAALQRSCAVQKNACANAANSGEVDGGVQACDDQEDECLGAAKRKLKLLRRGKILKLRQGGANRFGDCTNPAIQFAEGLDGRKEASFGPINKDQFDHGSALNIGIISNFICDRLGSSCKAGENTVTDCKSGAAAASGLKGQAAADAFNSALGL